MMKLPFYAKLAFSLLSLALIVLLLIVAKTVLVPLVFGCFFAVLLLPLQHFFEYKLRLPRLPAALLAVIILLLCVGGFVYFLAQQLVLFSQDLPELKQRISLLFGNLQHLISQEFHVTGKQQQDYLNQSTLSIVSTIANHLSLFFISSASFLFWMVFVFFYTFFVLYYRQLLLSFTLALFNPEHDSKVREVIKETRNMVYGYIKGLLLEMILIGLAVGLAFSILGVKYAILLALVTALLNIIPYLGIYSATAFIMLICFANSGAHAALWAGGTLFVIHFFDANILMPRIVGSRVRMNAFVTVLVVLIGDAIWGVSGMFLFIPLTGIFKIIAQRVPSLKAWALLIGTGEKE